MGNIGEIIKWTLNASSIILIVFLLEFTLGRKMKKTYQCILWGIVLIRLLLPSMPSSSWSLLNVLPQYYQIVSSKSNQFHLAGNLQSLVSQQDEVIELASEDSAEDIQSNTKLSDTSIGENVSTVNNSVQSNTIQSSNLRSGILQNKVLQRKELYIIWLIGAVGLSAYWIIGYTHAKRKIEKLEDISDEAVLELFEDCKRRILGPNRGKNIRLVEGDYSMIFGILRPMIILPRGKSDKELEVILLHELMHYRYKDYLMPYVQLIALSIHWFNPFVWLAVKQMKKDIEYACDERVITLGISKKQYANTLLSMMAVIQDKANGEVIPYMPISAFAQGMGSEAHEAKHRIKKIAGMKKSRVLSSVLSLVLVSFLTVGCLTDVPVKEETKGQEAVVTQSVQEEIKVQNIAVLGLDNGGVRVDTIFVGSINQETGSLKIISVPRDTKIVLDDMEKAAIEKVHGTRSPESCKLSELFDYSGKSLMQDVVLKEIEKLVDLKIDHYILIDVKAAEKMIDTLGGLEVNVPQKMSYDDLEQNLHIDLEPGIQYLAGYQVMGAVMFRRSTDGTFIYPEGDIGRIEMTQSVLKAIYGKLKQLSTPEEFIKIAKDVSSTVDTNLPLSDFMSYYNLLNAVKDENISFYILPGEARKENGRFYYIVDELAKNIQSYQAGQPRNQVN